MIQLLMILIFLPNLPRADEVEAAADTKLIRELALTEKYRLYQGEVTNRILMQRAMKDVGMFLLEECIYSNKRTCKFLVDLLTDKRLQPSTKCYGIMVAGYTCDKYEDIESCRIYKMHQKYCKELERTSP